MRRRGWGRGGSRPILFEFLSLRIVPKIAATARRPSPITQALRATTKSAKRSAKRNAIRLNNNTERIRFVPTLPPPILLSLALNRWRFGVFDLHPLLHCSKEKATKVGGLVKEEKQPRPPSQGRGSWSQQQVAIGVFDRCQNVQSGFSLRWLRSFWKADHADRFRPGICTKTCSASSRAGRRNDPAIICYLHACRHASLDGLVLRPLPQTAKPSARVTPTALPRFALSETARL